MVRSEYFYCSSMQWFLEICRTDEDIPFLEPFLFLREEDDDSFTLKVNASFQIKLLHPFDSDLDICYWFKDKIFSEGDSWGYSLVEFSKLNEYIKDDRLKFQVQLSVGNVSRLKEI